MLTTIPAHAFSQAEWLSVLHLNNWIRTSLTEIDSVSLMELLVEHFDGSLANAHFFLDRVESRNRTLLNDEVRLLKNVSVGMCNAREQPLSSACGLVVDLLSREIRKFDELALPAHQEKLFLAGID